MKMHHFALTFAIFIVALIMMVNLNIRQKMMAAEEVRKIDLAVEKATVAAADRLRGYRLNRNIEELNESVECFFDSLAADFGVADIPGKREEIMHYVPVIVITDTDGFRIAYWDVTEGEDGKEAVRRWTPKIYYTYSDNSAPTGRKATGFLYRFTGKGECLCCDINGIAGEKGKVYGISGLTETVSEKATEQEEDYYDFAELQISKRKNYDALILHPEEFELKRKEVMAAKLEEYMSYYCNSYNAVAKEFGIEYNFTIPTEDEEIYLRAADGVAFMAMFQGYPLSGDERYYNRFALSNTQVTEATVYAVDVDGKYHRTDCERKNTIVTYYNSRRECAENGAMPCECCR